jgi:hypothetical protein
MSQLNNPYQVEINAGKEHLWNNLINPRSPPALVVVSADSQPKEVN